MNYLVTESGLQYLTLTGLQYIVDLYADNPTQIQELDFSVDLMQVILWQYAQASNLQSLVQSKQDWYDTFQENFWNDWIHNVFDLRTANEFGLQVWSIILNFPIYISAAPPAPTKPTWGFTSTHKNFTRGNFSPNIPATYPLSQESARILLQLRYFQLVSSGTVPETNRMLAYVFEAYGAAWLIDNHDMTQSYYFAFPIPSDLLLVLGNFDILPRPAGVSSTIIQGG